MAEEVYVLHQARELPHVPQFLEGLDILGRDIGCAGKVKLSLVGVALVARHLGGGASGSVEVDGHVWADGMYVFRRGRRGGASTMPWLSVGQEM